MIGAQKMAAGLLTSRHHQEEPPGRIRTTVCFMKLIAATADVALAQVFDKEKNDVRI
ncbi:MAG: hypothetical protein P8J33_15905 [Pirellulaceae bacterium]|nr:hypothetical protein [Pirellulaceae bacterium]